jgi:uncharacterized protein YdhG (YjbR/CyaY superfamily)
MAESKAATKSSSKGFSAEEKAAMRERARELKAEERWNKNRAEGERALLAKLAEMPESDRALGERLHAIVSASAPSLSPKLWYGMPAWAKEGKVLCYFQGASRFDARYATFGFNDNATIDKGAMWPTSFAITELNAADEAKIAALVKKAVS